MIKNTHQCFHFMSLRQFWIFFYNFCSHDIVKYPIHSFFLCTYKQLNCKFVKSICCLNICLNKVLIYFWTFVKKFLNLISGVEFQSFDLWDGNGCNWDITEDVQDSETFIFNPNQVSLHFLIKVWKRGFSTHSSTQKKDQSTLLSFRLITSLNLKFLFEILLWKVTLYFPTLI